MSPSVILYYFTGTGNTGIVAGYIAHEFERQGWTVVVTRITQALLDGPACETAAYDLVGIGYPVHAFNAPRTVLRFLERLAPVKGQKAFVFKVPADPLMEGGSTTPVRHRLRRKGYDVRYEAMIVMPSNVVFAYDDRLSRQLCDKAQDKAAHMVGDILAGKSRALGSNVLNRALSWAFSASESFGARFFGKGLAVSGACRRCNRCVQGCPMGNISRVGEQVHFGWNCVMCLGCIYRCPARAITPRFMRFFIIKDGYDIHRIVENPTLEGNYLSSETRGYYRHYYDYIRQP